MKKKGDNISKATICKVCVNLENGEYCKVLEKKVNMYSGACFLFSDSKEEIDIEIKI